MKSASRSDFSLTLTCHVSYSTKIKHICMFPTTLNRSSKHGGIINLGEHRNFHFQSSHARGGKNRKLCLEKKLKMLQRKINYNGRKSRKEKNIFSNLLSLKISLNRKNEKETIFCKKETFLHVCLLIISHFH